MHRVELKVDRHKSIQNFLHKFLMHRVELKVGSSPLVHKWPHLVPNAPCGVESCYFIIQQVNVAKFLMHRVELKALQYLLLAHHL